ncbi:selenium metabolism-associated LysR family transcriptional regulator [Peribacillus frigoritolerans]|jgi:LysR family transcriptional regulator, transcriptional activator of the cysJI operon|uniref:selenium metabolism-associated LysR family transcriptional regulator n=1 Tax=Peribacillus TaxID=2675229 RepID=UPI0007BEDBC8|nr:selenium metabolism-associated LysR family transcriptional regulator [Peribacillus frigoritolerans]PHD77176.1 LysR family transcriptional regulator [Bacillus sp. AFS043905]PRS42429.1 LysR family transcriptional regulator [Bacillus sp. RJGP41]QNK47196.1 LysR family transcriptional regulator [Brevibacterium sp. PAMC23299]MCY8938391.1 LysR family transcriptional regulator [Peribacillus frigoritolerans]MDG4850538.1 selenium metabolism-associated LysR family transcriptional regulator [Peribacill
MDPLKVFVTVIEQQNFSRAGDILNLSQPGVSLHIRNLENELGTKLIYRSPKQVQITEPGKILYRHAKQMLNHYETAKREINEFNNVVSGTMKIGASFTIGEYYLPKVLAEFAAQYPMVDIQIIISNSNDVIQGIRSNKLDIGLIEGETDYKDIDVRPFMNDEMIVVVPPDHPLSQMDLIEGNMLQNQTWVLREQGSGTRTYSDKLLSSLELNIKKTFIFTSIQGVKEAVMAGLGIALLSRLTVQKELKSNELKTFHLKNEPLIRPFSIVKKLDFEASKAMELFLRKVEEFAIKGRPK